MPKISVALLSVLVTASPLFAQLSADGNQVWSQGGGIPGAAAIGDFFGNALAVGDFNGDGFLDLAVGVPGDNIGQNRGAVNVIYGSPDGLRGQGSQEWIQGRDGVEGNAERDDFFGSSLAAGDFDNDGFDDLAVGVPGEDNAQGIVAILYGTSAGLSAVRDQVWNQSDLAGGSRNNGDRFGTALTVGDFNGDGFRDLAIGTPLRNNASGLVHVVYGSPTGLTATGNQRFRQGADNLVGNQERGDFFGNSLAAGDFDGDGFDELAVGVPGEDNSRGGVQVLFGSPTGITPRGNVFLRQDFLIGANRRDNDAFGFALATGDFNQDGYVDLVASMTGVDASRGAIIVVNGAENGLTGPAIEWRQGRNGILGTQTPNDRFGSALAVGDFNGDGFPDLAVGASGEGDERGVVHAIYGSLGGLTAAGNQVFQQGVGGIQDSPEAGDNFGFALAAGDFGRGGSDDLAVSAPREDRDRGIVHVIYGMSTQLPLISGVVSAGLSQPFVTIASPNQIMTIFGQRFAPEGFARDLTGLDLVNGRVPTRLGGVCVEMGGQRAPIFFVNDTQVNFQAVAPPPGVTPTQPVRVIRNCDQVGALTSGAVDLESAFAAPEFFFFLRTQSGVNPVAAVNHTTGRFVGQPGLRPDAIFEAARPGDVVTLFVTGLGETVPRFGPGELPPGAATTARPVTVKLGATEITPIYAGVSPSFAGLYHVNFTVPTGVVVGNIQIALLVGEIFERVTTPPGAFILIGE